jgi:hypothetical protein
MGSSTIPAPSGGKTSYKLSLTSGTSWTVPSGVTYVNVTLVGGGGGGAGSIGATTAGGAGGSGGTTTFTGATSALGGNGNTAIVRTGLPSINGNAVGQSAQANTGFGGSDAQGYETNTGVPYQANGTFSRVFAQSGQTITSTIAVTAGAAITYAIGAGGTAGTAGTTGGSAGGAGGSGRIDIEYWA